MVTSKAETWTPFSIATGSWLAAELGKAVTGQDELGFTFHKGMDVITPLQPILYSVGTVRLYIGN